MNVQVLGGGVLIAYALYEAWPTIKAHLPSLPKISGSSLPVVDEKTALFQCWQKLANAVTTEKGKQLIKDLLVEIFGQ